MYPGALKAAVEMDVHCNDEEMECGSSYARSMASYALLLTCSGSSFDFHRRHMAFKPMEEGYSPFLWSCCTGWEEFVIKGNSSELTVAGRDRSGISGPYFPLRKSPSEFFERAE